MGTEITYTKEGGLRLCIATYQEPNRFAKWVQQWEQRLGIGKDREIEPESERIVYERENDKFRLVSGNETQQFLIKNGVMVESPKVKGRRCNFKIAAIEYGGFNLTRNVPLKTPSINRLVSEAKSAKIVARIS